MFVLYREKNVGIWSLRKLIVFKVFIKGRRARYYNMCVYNRKFFSVLVLSSISVNIFVEFIYVDYGNVSYCFKCMVFIVFIV